MILRLIRRRFIQLAIQSLLMGTLLFPFTKNSAGQFTIPPNDQSILGNVDTITAKQNDTLITIAQHYNLGVNAMQAANLGVQANAYLTDGMQIKVPAEFLLPALPRKGIIVNLPEMRLYYFLPGTNQLLTFPVGIGKIGKSTPITNTAILRKVTNPVWIPPADIREFDNKVLGINPPKIMPAGPDNPLGNYAIYLRVPTYLIHSTIYPESIGTRASFGCVRMNESDITEFFPLVKPGTPVMIIDMPNKLAWNEDKLYLEAHAPLAEDRNADYTKLVSVVRMIAENIPPKQAVMVNWPLVAELIKNPDGIPHPIAEKLS